MVVAGYLHGWFWILVLLVDVIVTTHLPIPVALVHTPLHYGLPAVTCAVRATGPLYTAARWITLVLHRSAGYRVLPFGSGPHLATRLPVHLRLDFGSGCAYTRTVPLIVYYRTRAVLRSVIPRITTLPVFAFTVTHTTVTALLRFTVLRLIFGYWLPVLSGYLTVFSFCTPPPTCLRLRFRTFVYRLHTAGWVHVTFARTVWIFTGYTFYTVYAVYTRLRGLLRTRRRLRYALHTRFHASPFHFRRLPRLPATRYVHVYLARSYTFHTLVYRTRCTHMVAHGSAVYRALPGYCIRRFLPTRLLPSATPFLVPAVVSAPTGLLHLARPYTWFPTVTTHYLHFFRIHGCRTAFSLPRSRFCSSFAVLLFYTVTGLPLVTHHRCGLRTPGSHAHVTVLRLVRYFPGCRTHACAHHVHTHTTTAYLLLHHLVHCGSAFAVYAFCGSRYTARFVLPFAVTAAHCLHCTVCTAVTYRIRFAFGSLPCRSRFRLPFYVWSVCYASLRLPARFVRTFTLRTHTGFCRVYAFTVVLPRICLYHTTFSSAYPLRSHAHVYYWILTFRLRTHVYTVVWIHSARICTFTFTLCSWIPTLILHRYIPVVMPATFSAVLRSAVTPHYVTRLPPAG